MKRHSTTIVVLAFVAAAILPMAQGCKKKPPTTTAEARPPVEAPAPPETRVPPPPAAAPRDVEVGDVMATDIAELNTKGYLKDAYFDYDQSDLREDARGSLSGNAEWLKRYPSIQVLIEGHCDERGTSAYNLALGDRRANAARDYLDSLGIASSRIRTVSYGKERPACTEGSESCWQQNRRAHFVITSK
ncbi:MAG TPA: peptidoglycan-associated lipoprotein Pal [Thermoanaerobaculia bacterium]|nr:peptidoglycan-associated lipoprotein Pal [Thermoanaerobaculia bacterium]HLN92581.1 peptidoglycan-associated lipoprotein Pal [Thermoanaerobaculia bacterium]